MAYKQNNPLSRKSNSTPLRHNVRNKKGNPWIHQHDGPNVTGKIDTGKVLRGSTNFGGDKRNKKIKGISETDSAMILANKIADQYNTGALAEGNFLADDFGKYKTYNRGGSKPKTLLGKITGVDAYTDYGGKFNVDFGDRRKGFSKGRNFNVKRGEWDDIEGVFKNIPTEQTTPEQIYDMMVQGGGMVSVVDGKIVAGNPNENTKITDYRSDKGGINYGLDAVPTGYEFIKEPNKKIYDERTQGYITNPYYDDQMSDYNSFYDEKSNTINETASKTTQDPYKNLTVKELLERRKQKSNSAINRVMGNSPLNTGHETDERSTEAREGFVYTPGEEVVTTKIEEVYGPDGVTVIGTSKDTTTTTPYTGTRNTPGTTKVITDEPNETPPNWDDCYENGIFQTGATVGEGVNAIKCELKPDPGPNPGGEPIIEDTQPVTEEHMYNDVNTETVFTPIEVEPKRIPPPELNFDSPGSIKSKGLQFKFGIPNLDLMGGIRAVIDGVVFTNSGKCKSGCATNKSS